MLFNWSFQYLCWLYISSVCFEHKHHLEDQLNQLVLLKNHWSRINGLVVNKIPVLPVTLYTSLFSWPLTSLIVHSSLLLVGDYTIDFPKCLASYLSCRTQLSSPCWRVYKRLSPRLWPLTCLIVHSSLLLVGEYTIDFHESLASYLSHCTQLSSPYWRVYNRLSRESGLLPVSLYTALFSLLESIQ